MMVLALVNGVAMMMSSAIRGSILIIVSSFAAVVEAECEADEGDDCQSPPYFLAGVVVPCGVNVDDGGAGVCDGAAVVGVACVCCGAGFVF